jgi:hypothetical protein
MVVPLVAGAAVTAGLEALSALLKIATTPDGIEWIGRKLKDDLPALRARVRANKHVKIAGKGV